jgi:hypothetical protein
VRTSAYTRSNGPTGSDLDDRPPSPIASPVAAPVRSAAANANPHIAERSAPRQMRYAVVLQGGVSIAVWMGGVAAPIRSRI